MFHAQLVCGGCSKIVTYPLGALSTRCRGCQHVNPAENMAVVCPGCSTTLYFPINTLSGLCPCCCAVIEIPVEMLPQVPEPASGSAGAMAAPSVTMYVENPNTVIDGRSVPCVSVATKVL